MPTQTQLTALANELYDKPISETGRTNATRDNEKAISMGFITSASSPFFVWSGEEFGKYEAYNRVFYSTSTFRYGVRYEDDGHAVCLAE